LEKKVFILYITSVRVIKTKHTICDLSDCAHYPAKRDFSMELDTSNQETENYSIIIPKK
jgi:hypothetical protein